MEQLETIELDGYDRELFFRLLRTEPGLSQSAERLGRLLPHPEPLLTDLFGVLFKLNVLVRPKQELSPAVLLNRRLVQAVLGHPGTRALRAGTALDESKTRDALVLIADRLLRALTRRGRLDPSHLADAGEVAEAQAALDDKRRVLDHIAALDGEDGLDPSARQDAKKAIQEEVARLEAQLRAARDRLDQQAEDLPIDLDNEIASSVERIGGELAELDAQLRGLGVGGGGTTDARRRLELGERLAASKKLRLLAKLAGAFKDVAFEARKRALLAAPQTTHAVTQGRDLGRMLPSELPGLDRRRRGVHLDFLRRYVEGRLLQYDLRAPARRGPMVVCVDGSGSMTGSKEIWAKAVALTLMEIARRERRRCLALVFCDSETPFEVELLAPRAGSRPVVNDAAVLAFAEHFPGGGTRFEPPLTIALEAVTHGAFRRGDILFITDGEAPVSAELAAAVTAARKKHRFKLRAILVGGGGGGDLHRVADEVRRVEDLAGDALADLYAAV